MGRMPKVEGGKTDLKSAGKCHQCLGTDAQIDSIRKSHALAELPEMTANAL